LLSPGQHQHEEARETGMTCIDRHHNHVHDKVELRLSFFDSTGGTN
jgi:nitrate/TMAO reductase-like tetraheme cytochrome c subunit